MKIYRALVGVALICVSAGADAYAEGYWRVGSAEVSDSVSDGGYIGYYVNDEVVSGDISVHSVLPEKYDSRDYGYITSVKNQGQEGCCWAFAEIGAIEANLIKKGLVTNDGVDYSEAHAAWFGINSYDNIYKDGIKLYDPYSAYNMGGNDQYMIFALSKRSGLDLEKNVPYEKRNDGNKEIQRFSSRVRLKNNMHYSLSDTDGIKKAIMEYGAATYGMYADWKKYLADNGAYYCPKSDVSGNHEVLIVGWDDNYSADNFKDKPKRNGAWIAKNSYGEKSGVQGYYMISYENTAEDCHAAVFDMDLEDYDNLYLYDGAGISNYLEWFLDKDFTIKDMEARIAGANIFTAENDEILKAVSYYTYAPTDYEIHIYRGSLIEGAEEVEEAYTSGRMDSPGYYTIELNNAVSLSKGEVFTAAIVLEKGERFYFEYPGAEPWRTNAGMFYRHYEEGQSMIGIWRNGKIEDWGEWGNISIKALTDDADNKAKENELNKLNKLIESAENMGIYELIQKAAEVKSINLSAKAEIHNAYIELLTEYNKYTGKNYVVTTQLEDETLKAEAVLLDGEASAVVTAAYYDNGRFMGMQSQPYDFGKTEYTFDNVPQKADSYKVMILKEGIVPVAYYAGEVISK